MYTKQFKLLIVSCDLLIETIKFGCFNAQFLLSRYNSIPFCEVFILKIYNNQYESRENK